MNNKILLSSFIFLVAALFFTSPIHAQIITTIAGNGIRGYSGDGGPATAAMLDDPGGVTVDDAGNIYIDVPAGCISRIRKIDASSIIHAYAGATCACPCIGYSGDGGPAISAELDSHFLTTDHFGNIYFADGTQHIRKINSAGIISTIAGTGVAGFGGDGGPATAALLNFPHSITADGMGNLYFGDAYNHRLRRIDAAGVITTIAGIGVKGYGGDGGPATAAVLCFPGGIAFDQLGNLYFSDSQRVRKIDAAGIITTFAGTGVGGYGGDGGQATAALIQNPGMLATDRTGNVYIPDLGHSGIRKVNKAGIISTVAGTGVYGYGGDGGPATAASFALVNHVSVDCGHNLYIGDSYNYRVRKITYNHAPVLPAGATHSLTICAGAGIKQLDTLLAAADLDTLQDLVWSVVRTPAHGVLTAAYSTATNGDTLLPTGTGYTAATGYTGADTFAIAATDCGHLSDTILVYVTVLAIPVAAATTGGDTICTGSSTTLVNATAGGTWTATNSRATVAAGIVTGVAPGADTIIYTVSNACGADTVQHVIVVKTCPAAAPNVSAVSGSLMLYPNPVGDVLHVDGLRSITSYQLRSMVGVVAGEDVLANGGNTIDVKNLPGGVYMLALCAEDGWKVVLRVMKIDR